MMKKRLLECPNCHNFDTDDAWNQATCAALKTFNITKTTDSDAKNHFFVCPYCSEQVHVIVE